MTKHPSGRPRPKVKRGVISMKNWTRTESVVSRLDQPRRDLPGGFGFGLPRIEHNDDDGGMKARK